MTHDYHEKLPGYHPDQVLHDGCAECEDRGADPNLAIQHMDVQRFQHAWQRAADWQKNGTAPLIAHAEIDTLRLLWAVQVQFERLGVPIGMFPVGLEMAVELDAENLRLREQAGEMAEQIERLQRELTEARVRSGELGVGALIATSPAERIIAAGTSPAELARDLADAAEEDGYDGPVT